MNNKILNPFLRIAGLKSLIIGLVILIFTSLIAYRTGTHYYSLLYIDFAKDTGFWVFLGENISQWIIISILFLSAGLIISKSKIRVVDVFGTTVFSRIPLIIVPLIRLIPIFQSFAFRSVMMYLVFCIYLISLIWTVILFYNAFRISCNLKNEKLIFSFTLCIILSEFITNLLLLQLK